MKMLESWKEIKLKSDMIFLHYLNCNLKSLKIRACILRWIFVFKTNGSCQIIETVINLKMHLIKSRQQIFGFSKKVSHNTWIKSTNFILLKPPSNLLFLHYYSIINCYGNDRTIKSTANVFLIKSELVIVNFNSRF